MSTFTVDELEEIRFGSFADLELVRKDIQDQSRWSVAYSYTFRAPKRPHEHGDLYQFWHYEAATEYQEDDEIDPDSVYPVVAKEITTTIYVKPGT